MSRRGFCPVCSKPLVTPFCPYCGQPTEEKPILGLLCYCRGMLQRAEGTLNKYKKREVHKDVVASQQRTVDKWQSWLGALGEVLARDADQEKSDTVP